MKRKDESQEKNEQIEIANSGNSIATSITWVRKQIEALSQLQLQNVKTLGRSKTKPFIHFDNAFHVFPPKL